MRSPLRIQSMVERGLYEGTLSRRLRFSDALIGRSHFSGSQQGAPICAWGYCRRNAARPRLRPVWLRWRGGTGGLGGLGDSVGPCSVGIRVCSTENGRRASSCDRRGAWSPIRTRVERCSSRWRSLVAEAGGGRSIVFKGSECSAPV